MAPRFQPERLAEWAVGKWVSSAPAVITGIVHDTRAVSEGDLFVALRGTRADGHAFVADARRRGACGAIVRREQAAELAATGPLLAVADPLAALQDIAAGYRRLVAARIVGVTGSTGKTTVKELIAGMLAPLWRTARTRGNWNNEIGLPLSLLAMEPDTQVGVFELGISHPGEMAPLCRMARPDWGVVTTVGPVHLEFFPSVDSIASEKGELLRQLPAGGVAVLSVDDPHFAALRDCVPGALITVSLASPADYRLEAGAAADLVTVRERATGESCILRMPMPGRHSRHNVLLATAVARGLGVSWAAIAEGLARYTPPPMRWETHEAGGVTLINDAYNANPLSMRAALETFRDLAVPGRKWLVLGDMRELGPRSGEEHAVLGRQVAEGDWASLVAVGELGAVVADGAVAAGWPPERVFRGAATEGVAFLADRLRAGDAVLFKASRGMHLEDAVAGLGERLAARTKSELRGTDGSCCTTCTT